MEYLSDWYYGLTDWFKAQEIDRPIPNENELRTALNKRLRFLRELRIEVASGETDFIGPIKGSVFLVPLRDMVEVTFDKDMLQPDALTHDIHSH